MNEQEKIERWIKKKRETESGEVMSKVADAIEWGEELRLAFINCTAKWIIKSAEKRIPYKVFAATLSGTLLELVLETLGEKMDWDSLTEKVLFVRAVRAKVVPQILSSGKEEGAELLLDVAQEINSTISKEKGKEDACSES